MQILKQGIKADIKAKQNHKTAIIQTSQKWLKMAKNMLL